MFCKLMPAKSVSKMGWNGDELLSTLQQFEAAICRANYIRENDINKDGNTSKFMEINATTLHDLGDDDKPMPDPQPNNQQEIAVAEALVRVDVPLILKSITSLW